MVKVFISYSHADADKAKIIHDKLIDEGMQVFHDKDIQSGSNWRDIIIDGIAEADIGLVLLSPASIQSPYVRREILQLSAQNKRLYGALVSDLGDVELPKFLDGIQYVNLENIDSLIFAMKNLEDVQEGVGNKIYLDLNTYTITFRADDPNKLKDIIEKLSQSGIEDLKIQKAYES